MLLIIFKILNELSFQSDNQLLYDILSSMLIHDFSIMFLFCFM